MSITAGPVLTVAGLTIPAAPAGDGSLPPLAGVDKLRLTWGRGDVLSAPTPATAALSIIDTTTGATFARRTDLIGQVVVLGWAASDGSSGTNFRGRITDVAASPRAAGGFRVDLAASSVEVDLANYKQPEATVWPAETFAARRTRILGQIPAGMIAGGITLPTRFDLGLQYATTPATDLSTYTAAQVDVSSKDVLALVRELFASTSPLPAVYDPAADRFTFPARRLFAYTPAGFTASAMLLASPDHAGRYVPAGTSQLHLDAGQVAYAGALDQRIDSRVTRVEVAYLDQTVAYDSRTATAATVHTPVEATLGRRTLAVSTVQADAGNAAQLATLYADVASAEASTPRLGSVSWSSKREPLHDAAHARLLLAGVEGAPTVFLGDSWLPRLGQRPLVSFLGATVTYSGGDWTVEALPGPTIIDPRPGSWAPVTIAASAVAGVRLRDIDRSTTFGDLAYIDVGAGYTTLTASPYKGNPT